MNLFFMALEMGRPKSRDQEIQCLVRPASWFIDCPLFTITPNSRRGEGALQILFYKGPNLIREGFTLMT